MKQIIKFTKMHGAGNDYIFVDTTNQHIERPVDAAIVWTNRNTGIGGDGLILFKKLDSSEEADFSMRIFNSDGSEAEMCGNAARCIAKYAYEHGMIEKSDMILQTKSGSCNVHLNTDTSGALINVTVDMGEPILSDKSLFNLMGSNVIEVAGKEFIGTFVNLGTPHYVIFGGHLSTQDMTLYGSAIERHPAFPQRCNVVFAQVIAPNCIRTRVWERGSGITQACGSSACATAVAAKISKRADEKCRIVMDGGTLFVNWDEQTNHVMLTGPATFVYEGQMELPVFCSDSVCFIP
ncbi:MAG: diaminopimelate epimerase [Prevotellaceae bacterium]|nr:diaminopimelate epimerase [Prevotella sp.]MDD7530895.1 diaminopimelate epimerase [Prevotellaceae bacterium]MDY2633031.1 diaminopimelate epimerase [Prevotella sp.]